MITSIYDELDVTSFREHKSNMLKKEIEEWKTFLADLAPSRAKELLTEVLTSLEADKAYECDDLLLDNYKSIAGNPLVESWLMSAAKPINHPMYDMFVAQWEISRRKKPRVGDTAERQILPSRSQDGLYNVMLSRPDKNNMMRISGYKGDWRAVDLNNPGLVVFITEHAEVNWSHLEITHIDARTCRARPLYLDINELIKREVLEFRAQIRDTGKVKIHVEW